MKSATMAVKSDWWLATDLQKSRMINVRILTDMAHTDDKIDEKAAEIAVRRAREAMSDPLNTSEEQAELEISLKRSMAEIEFKRRRRSSRSKA